MGCPTECFIGDNLVFSVGTHNVATGAVTDADAVPTYRLYEDETATPILTGSMAKLDDTNTTGFYTELIAVTSGNGFENGKTYTIYISSTVNSITAIETYTFKARTALNDFDPANDTVANVTTVATCTTNSDMRGTDNAALASSLVTHDNNLAVVDGKVDTIDTNVDQLLLDVAAVVTDVMTYAVEGSVTFEQFQRIFLAALAGITTNNGAIFKDLANLKARITATVDANNNRTNIVLDGS
jgi:hypothetical protein